MKLSIGVNIHKHNIRQDLAIKVLKKLKTKYPDCINLYNITFKDEKNINDFIHLPELKTTSNELIPGSVKNKPTTKELFNTLSTTDCDYFLFLNSDILLSEQCLKLLLKKEWESYIFSRTDIEPINSLTDRIKPLRIEVAGFDGWCIKKDIWLDIENLFPNFIYGEPYWDMYYALMIYKHTKCFFGNKNLYLLHPYHQTQWNEESLEAKYNNEFWKKEKFSELWHNYVHKCLVTRTPSGRFFDPLINELELEKQFKA